MEKIIVYGLGRAYENIKNYLELNYQIVALCDKRKLEGAILPSEIANVENYDKIFVTSTKYFTEIKETLINEYEIDEKRILCADILKTEVQKKADFFCRWVLLGESGVTMQVLLQRRGYKSIALYGYNDIARCILYAQKNKTPIVRYIIDKNADNLPISYSSIFPADFVPKSVDAVIICIPYHKSVDEMQNQNDCEVITFEELIYDL